MLLVYQSELDLQMQLLASSIRSASGGEMCRMMLFEILTLWHVVCQKVWRRELVRLQRMAPKLAMLLGGYELLMGRNIRWQMDWPVYRICVVKRRYLTLWN
jgi:hypothetical protein